MDLTDGTVTRLDTQPTCVPDFGYCVRWSPDGKRVAFTDAKGWEATRNLCQVVEPFVMTVRKARAETPVLLVEDRSYANSYLLPEPRKRNTESRAAWLQILSLLDRTGAKPVVDQVFPFDLLPAAFSRLAEGPLGKVLLATA